MCLVCMNCHALLLIPFLIDVISIHTKVKVKFIKHSYVMKFCLCVNV